MKRLIPLMLLTSTLTACGPGLFLAGAATGSLIAYDHKQLASLTTDQKIRHNLGKAIYNDADFNNSHIVISSFNSNVLLAGETSLASLRAKAEKIARRTPKVKKVYNEITIAAPSTMMSQSADAWTTTKVKTALIAQKNLDSAKIKVLTENGTVYLMGQVDPKQATLAVKATQHVKGVKKIVKVFS